MKYEIGDILINKYKKSYIIENIRLESRYPYQLRRIEDNEIKFWIITYSEEELDDGFELSKETKFKNKLKNL